MPGRRILVILALPVCANAASVQCQAEGTNLTCLGDGELTSSHVISSGKYTRYTYADLSKSGITILGNKCLSGCKLSSIDLPRTVTTFMSTCFENCQFTSFTIPKQVVNISYTAWNGCTKLTHFYAESGNSAGFTAQDGFLLQNGDLFSVASGRGRGETVTLPSCESILSNAMRWNDCKGVIIHNNTLNVGGMAFYGCDLMENITLGTKLETWSSTALTLCTAVTTIKLNGNTNFYFSNGAFGKKDSNNKKTSILWIADSVTQLTISSTVTEIGQGLLQGRRFLKNVSVASGHTKFKAACSNRLILNKENGAFQRACHCVGGATTITIPSSVTTLYSHLFRGCKLLTSVTLHSGVNKFHSDVFKECSNLTKIDFKSCEMKTNSGESKTSNFMCGYCSKLTTILNWPTNTFYIGSDAFEHCGFVTLSLPDECTQILQRGFQVCSSLEQLTIPKTVTYIGIKAFYNCKKLKTVTFTSGSTLKTIESLAFAGCTSLVEITLPYTLTEIDWTSFQDDTSLTKITMDYNNGTYASDGMSLYKKSGTNQFYAFVLCSPGADRVILREEAIVINSYAFGACGKLNDVVIGNSVTEIKDNAFYECSAIEFVRIPSSVRTLGTSPFNGCARLKEILYCGSNTNVECTGSPFPISSVIYVSRDAYQGDEEECAFCGHKCYPILDIECSLPSHIFKFVDRETSLLSRISAHWYVYVVNSIAI